jgi:hypothetical protein
VLIIRRLHLVSFLSPGEFTPFIRDISPLADEDSLRMSISLDKTRMGFGPESLLYLWLALFAFCPDLSGGNDHHENTPEQTTALGEDTADHSGGAGFDCNCQTRLGESFFEADGDAHLDSHSGCFVLAHDVQIERRQEMKCPTQRWNWRTACGSAPRHLTVRYQ